MQEVEQIGNSISETLKNSDFQGIIADLSEVGLDSLFDDGLVKDIPIIGILFGIRKTSLSIQDKLFTKKLLSFLANLKSTTTEERRIQIEKIDSNQNYKTKVGEKILYIIDKCDDAEKAALIGKLFKCFIKEELNYDDFLLASRAIELTHLLYLKYFIKFRWTDMDFEEAGDLVATGLMNGIYRSPKLIGGDHLEDGTLHCMVSEIGGKIQNLLKEDV